MKVTIFTCSLCSSAAFAAFAAVDLYKNPFYRNSNTKLNFAYPTNMVTGSKKRSTD